jgi:hypothetical protein
MDERGQNMKEVRAPTDGPTSGAPAPADDGTARKACATPPSSDVSSLAGDDTRDAGDASRGGELVDIGR